MVRRVHGSLWHDSVTNLSVRPPPPKHRWWYAGWVARYALRGRPAADTVAIPPLSSVATYAPVRFEPRPVKALATDGIVDKDTTVRRRVGRKFDLARRQDVVFSQPTGLGLHDVSRTFVGRQAGAVGHGDREDDFADQAAVGQGVIDAAVSRSTLPVCNSMRSTRSPE